MFDTGGDFSRMRMLVVIVVRMVMFMFKQLMVVRVFMSFADVQPYAKGHQRAGDQQLRCHRLAHADDGYQRTGERRG